MIKAVYFDAIKTLFKPMPSEAGLYVKVVKDILDIDITEDEIRPILEDAMVETEKLDAVKNNSIQQWEHYPMIIAKRLGCPENECKVAGDKLRFETWGNPNNYSLYEDILPALNALRASGIYIACVSNEDGWLGQFFDHFNISDYFTFILASGEIGIEKPAPGIFNKALEMGGFKPSEVLFVGDSLISDYNGAKNVGMQPLLIDRLNKNNDDIIKTDSLNNIMEFIK